MGSDDLHHKRHERKKAALQRRKSELASNKRYLIVCEGTKTEPHYFYDLLTDQRIDAHVRIAPNDGCSPDRIVEHALNLYKKGAASGDEYDQVYCVFDRDKHTTFAAAVERINALRAKGKPLETITSTPCFEFWLLLHFGYNDQPFHATGKNSIGDQAVKKLKSKPGFSDYEKGKKGIYAELKDKIEDAFKHAKRLREANEKTNNDNPATDIDTLVLALRSLKK